MSGSSSKWRVRMARWILTMEKSYNLVAMGASLGKLILFNCFCWIFCGESLDGSNLLYEVQTIKSK